MNPPDNPKASYFVGDDYPADAAAWRLGATRTAGSWWTDWSAWLDARSGNWKAAPKSLGNATHPVLCDAPGTYVSS